MVSLAVPRARGLQLALSSQSHSPDSCNPPTFFSLCPWGTAAQRLAPALSLPAAQHHNPTNQPLRPHCTQPLASTAPWAAPRTVQLRRPLYLPLTRRMVNEPPQSLEDARLRPTSPKMKQRPMLCCDAAMLRCFERREPRADRTAPCEPRPTGAERLSTEHRRREADPLMEISHDGCPFRECLVAALLCAQMNAIQRASTRLALHPPRSPAAGSPCLASMARIIVRRSPPSLHNLH